MPVLYYFPVFLLLLLSGCDIFNSQNDSISPIFKAQINGEPFDISSIDEQYIKYTAGISPSGVFFISGGFYRKESYPYNHSINVILLYQQGNITYSTALDTILTGFNRRPVGGTYYEVMGDAMISAYRTLENDTGYITVQIDTLNSGKMAISGTFEYTAVISYRNNEFSMRTEQDTLYITDGEYRLPLEDRRNNE